MKLYEQLSSDIQQRIETGFYQSNQKLPSIRDMSTEQNVSISTVQEAYRMLEDTGFAISKPKSGYYVKRPIQNVVLPDTSQPEQKPVEVKYWDEVLALSTTRTTDGFTAFGRGGLNTKLHTLKPLQRIHASIVKKQPHQYLSHETGNGSYALRKQIARLMLKSGCKVHPDDILITTGCQEALSLSLKALTKPGDIVAMDSPGFFGTVQALRSNGLKALEIPTHPEKGISLTALEMALEQWPIKVIQLVPTINNPTGYIMSDERKKKLVELAIKYDVTIIEDDINGELVYQNPRPRSIKSFDKDGRVLLCSSFSKTVSSGLRVGWIVAGGYGKILTHLKFITSLASSTLPQLAMAEFIEDGHYEKHLRNLKLQSQRNRDSMICWVQKYFPKGTKMTYPKGGFQLWVELPQGIDSLKLNDNLKAFNIGIAPGTLFSSSGKSKNCLRINYASDPNSHIENCIKCIGEQAHLLMTEKV